MNRDAFSGYHPSVTMLYFVLAIGLTMFLNHPVCLGLVADRRIGVFHLPEGAEGGPF